MRKPLWAPVVRGEGREAPREPGYKSRRPKAGVETGRSAEPGGAAWVTTTIKGSFAFGHRAPFAYRGD